MKISKISKEYFDLNPKNKVDSLNQIDVPFQKEYTPIIDQDLTGKTYSELIQRVFENKSISELNNNDATVFADGGDTSAPESDMWKPYDFLHTLLKKVYGRDYVVTDAQAAKLNNDIADDESKIQKQIDKELKKYDANNIFELPVEVFEKIDNQRKALEERKSFISHSELEAYAMTNSQINNDDYVKKFKRTKDELVDEGLIFYDLNDEEPKWTYRYLYLSGNIQDKISNLHMLKADYLEKITEKQYDQQLKALNNSRNELARIKEEGQNNIYIFPNSLFAKDKDEFTIEPEDWKFVENLSNNSLSSAFRHWLTTDEVSSDDFQKVPTAYELISIYVDGESPSDAKDEREKTNRKQNAHEEGDRLFNKFLNTALTDKCKQRLEAVWNAKFNNLVQAKLHKIPVALSVNKVFKNGSPFIPNPSQIQSVQFEIAAGSGLLAYGVGVGKTASSILNVSYAMDNNLCDKPMFVVPNATFDKWMMEIQGGFVDYYEVSYDDGDDRKTKVFNQRKDAKIFQKQRDGKLKKKTKYSHGLLPDKNIVPLYNLNKDIILNDLKEYSDEEVDELEKMDELKKYLSSLSSQTDLQDRDVSSRIRDLYDDYEIENVQKMYNDYAADYEPDWFTGKQKKKGTPKTMFDWFRKSMYDYINELPFKLGVIKNFPKNSIFMLTYEGLTKLGVEKEPSEQIAGRLQDQSMFGQIFNEVSQGEVLSQIREGGGSAELRMLEQSFYGEVGKPKIYLSELGTDYAVFDESHNFKKVFVKSKGTPKYNSPDHYNYFNASGKVNRHNKKYNLGESSVSKRSLSAYCLIRFIQMNNKGSNVCHLTATPFTNNPIEVYSMLALTNYDLLKKSGYRWVESFYDVFMKISFQVRITASQNVRNEEILVGYNNAPQMRNIIFQIMDYKSGDDANIKRPNKLVFPSYEKGIDTVLPADPKQEQSLKLIRDYMRGDRDISEICDLVKEEIDVTVADDSELVKIIIEEGTEAQKTQWEEFANSELSDVIRGKAEEIAQKIIDSQPQSIDDSGKDFGAVRILKGLNFMKQVTLSPYLFACRTAGGEEPTPTEFVETSPKIRYALKCIKSIHDYETKNTPYKNENVPQRSGIIVFMNTGINPKAAIQTESGVETVSWNDGGLEKIKKYLVSEYGYKESEISIVRGGMSSSAKEREKNKFLAGDSVVLLGSSTISTGIDLQNNTSALFPLTYEWNPTDAEQLIGRFWRQGNRFADIRVAFPMIENSSDPVIFQLLQEKTLRIKEIWDKDGKTSTLDLRDFNPSDLKKKLITDPESKTEYWYQENAKELEDDLILFGNQLKRLKVAQDNYETVEDLRVPMQKALKVIDHFKKKELQDKSILRNKRRVDEVTEEHMYEDPDLLAKKLKEINKSAYDHKKDPEGRYVPKSFDGLTDDKLKSELTKMFVASDGWWNHNRHYGVVSDLNVFISQEYPDLYQGKWISGEELSSMESEKKNIEDAIDALNNEARPIKDRIEQIPKEKGYENYAEDPEYVELKGKFENLRDKYNEHQNELEQIREKIKKSNGRYKLQFSPQYGGTNSDIHDWINAYKLFQKDLDRLKMMGVEVENISTTKKHLQEKVKELGEELDTLEAKKPEMMEKFTLEERENKSVAPSVDERVEEFSKENAKVLNSDSELVTFKGDKEPTVSESNIEESRTVVKAEEKTSKKPEAVENTSEEDYINEKISLFKTMLEVEDDKEEKEYIENKIELYEMMLDPELI